MGIKIFSKCGITLILFPLILALFSIMGCIDKGPQLSQAPSFGAEDQQLEGLSSHLQMDFEAEVKSNLFCVRGKVLLLGNGSLPYLMLNATLVRDGRAPLMRTKYLLMQIEPNRDYSFEISKNMRIQPETTTALWRSSGPKGTLALESRKCSLAESHAGFRIQARFRSPRNARIRRTEGTERRWQKRREGVLRESEIERRGGLEDAVAEKKSSNKAGNAGQKMGP